MGHRVTFVGKYSQNSKYRAAEHSIFNLRFNLVFQKNSY